MKLAYLATLILNLSCICDAYKILLVFPNLSRSHQTLGIGYAKHLLNAGHEVTLVTPFPWKNLHPKLQQIDVSDNLNVFKPEKFTIKALMGKETYSNMFEVLKLGVHLYFSYSYESVKNNNVQKLLNDDTNTFDLVIAEWFISDLFAGFATVFNCPLIWSSSTEAHWMVLSLLGESSNPAYSPDMNTAAIHPFTFAERVSQLAFQTFSKILHYFFISSNDRNGYKELFGPAIAKRGRTLPSFEEILYNASFVFANSHPSYGQSITMPQNCKDIGGYWIENETEPLSKNLKTIMDTAENGFIYFSMGSIWKSKDMPDVITQSLLKEFRGLKQTVLWKYEDDMPNLPKNVHILKWAPQRSILAHPNCRLFITHGGVLSITETVHFGVPVIGVPVGYDQHLNIRRAVAKGYAIKVDLSYDMSKDLILAIDEILTNPRFMVRAKEVSQIYHDRVVPPSKELVHWVEHMVRTRGAPHLRSPALMLPWYQKMYLDLIALILVGLFILVLLIKHFLLMSTRINMSKKNK